MELFIDNLVCLTGLNVRKNIRYGLNHEMTPKLENKEKGGNIL